MNSEQSRKKAAAIVVAIEKDLKTRDGLAQEWNCLPPAERAEVREDWRRILMAELRRG